MSNASTPSTQLMIKVSLTRITQPSNPFLQSRSQHRHYAKPRGTDTSITDSTPLLVRPSNNLKMGIVGLPNIGKSTLFNILTESSAPAENYPFCTIDPNESRVQVPDERFDWLVETYKPKGVIPSFMSVVDIAGLVRNASEGEGLGNAFLSNIKATDGIYHLIRGFEDPNVTHVEGDLDPIRDLEIIHLELRLKDSDQINQLQTSKRPTGSKTKATPADIAVYQKLHKEVVVGDKDVRDVDWNAEEAEIVTGLQLLTAKPMVYLVNVSEEEAVLEMKGVDAIDGSPLHQVREWVDKNHPGSPVIGYSGEFESMLSQLETAEEKQDYVNEVAERNNVKVDDVRSMVPDIVWAGYRSMGLMNFFTCGEVEVRSWTVRKGVKAPKAASVIHSDFERLFIAADVVRFDDLKELGSEAAVKAAGKGITKGKDASLEDGDVVYFKISGGGTSSMGKSKKTSGEPLIGRSNSAFLVELQPGNDAHAIFRDVVKMMDFSGSFSPVGTPLTERNSFNTLFHGLSVVLPGGYSDAEKLLDLDIVKDVWPVNVYQRPINPNHHSHGTEKLMASTASLNPLHENTEGPQPHLPRLLDQTWSQINFHVSTKPFLNTKRGDGIKIGIIDSGIDYTHPGLGGCFGNGCTFAYGYDVVGDGYHGPGTTPEPDNDPMDCAGHGTHVAGLIAANSSIITGIAPFATFGMYRVFGCDGGSESDIIMAAMEMAYRDGMNVLNLSIGGSSEWPEYPEARVAARLVERGMVVVASQGNDAPDGLWLTSAPAVAHGVISVGAVENAYYLGGWAAIYNNNSTESTRQIHYASNLDLNELVKLIHQPAMSVSLTKPPAIGPTDSLDTDNLPRASVRFHSSEIEVNSTTTRVPIKLSIIPPTTIPSKPIIFGGSIIAQISPDGFREIQTVKITYQGLVRNSTRDIPLLTINGTYPYILREMDNKTLSQSQHEDFRLVAYQNDTDTPIAEIVFHLPIPVRFATIDLLQRANPDQSFRLIGTIDRARFVGRNGGSVPAFKVPWKWGVFVEGVSGRNGSSIRIGGERWSERLKGRAAKAKAKDLGTVAEVNRFDGDRTEGNRRVHGPFHIRVRVGRSEVEMVEWVSAPIKVLVV
ncbi:hypothetical protein HDU76_002445 [Blyttiomyces sp. JEL0837]|nr:hypothetical protein HDU76_002445 [Blyttiomyces sp. JEL0837]